MAQWLNWGDGSDGSPNAISGTINTYATCTGTAGQTVLTTALSASDGDQILIHQTRHASAAGIWEIVKVSSDGGATLNLYSALVNSYSAGAQAVLIPQYTGGNISGAVTDTNWDGTSGGIIALMSNGDLTISGSLTADGGYLGGAKGTGAGNEVGCQGEGVTAAGGTRSTSANGIGAGGGGANNSPGGTGSGGGGGGYATSGSNGANPGTGGGTFGNTDLTVAVFGGGGGGGGSDDAAGNAGAPGGKGGGIVFVFAKNLTITGTINVNGTNGGNYVSTYGGAAGGGAGGSCLIKCSTATLGTNRITASGGTKGTIVGGQTGIGGDGGVGRIHIDYFSSYTGTTTPTINAFQDLTLIVTASSGFFNFF